VLVADARRHPTQIEAKTKMPSIASCSICAVFTVAAGKEKERRKS